jgi:hypothetical protein
MKLRNLPRWRALLALLGAAALVACDNNGNPVEPVVPPLTDTT